MQCLVDVQLAPDGWVVQLLDPSTGAALVDPVGQVALLDQPRRLRFVGGLPGTVEAFPLPPAAEAAALPSGAPHRDLCNAADAAPLAASLAAIVNLAPGDDGAVKFGHYLFATLLGDDLWARVQAAAGAGPLELAITLSGDDSSMLRLPWEAMHGPDLVLAQLPSLVITRRIRDDQRPASTPWSARVVEVDSPLRVLFVVGAAANSDEVRLGVEYLGLLRGLRRGPVGLNHQVLFRATPQALEAAVRWFRPNVIHLICHVSCVGQACGLRLNCAKGPVTLDAGELLNRLRTAGDQPLPAAVVLGVAVPPGQTAAPDAAEAAGRLAVDLVKGGVPLVVTLAGEATEPSCRLFMRRFYEALLCPAQCDLAQEAALGRRMGLPDPAVERLAGNGTVRHQGVYPWTTSDWALPRLVMPDAAVEVRPRAERDDWLIRCHSVATGYYLDKDFPAFCARMELFELYDGLLRGAAFQAPPAGRGELQALAITVAVADDAIGTRPQYGRTWLLEEFAAKAVRDGHVPLMLTEQVLPSQRSWPKTLPDLLDCLVMAATETCTRFGQAASSWRYVKALRRMALRGEIDLLPELKAEPEIDATYNNDPSDSDVLAIAFRLDLLRFRDDVRRGGPAPAAAADADDPLAGYERGLDRLLERLRADPQSDHYRDALVFEQRLRENIRRARRYTDTPIERADRNQILDQLGQLTQAALGRPFQELTGAEAPTTAATAAPEAAWGEKARVVLLIDDVHRLGEAAAPLLEHLLGPRTMDAAHDDLRVVFTYSSTPLPEQKSAVDAINEWRLRGARKERLSLEEFQSGAEEELAYRHFLLHWKDQSTGDRLRLAPVRENPRVVEHFFTRLKDEVKGIPSYLARGEVASLVRAFSDETAPPMFLALRRQPQ
jgi:hypothetical protein